MDWKLVEEKIVQDDQKKWDRKAAGLQLRIFKIGRLEFSNANGSKSSRPFLAEGHWRSTPLDRSFERLRKRVTRLPCLTCGRPIETDQSFVAITEDRAKHLKCWENEEGSN